MFFQVPMIFHKGTWKHMESAIKITAACFNACQITQLLQTYSALHAACMNLEDTILCFYFVYPCSAATEDIHMLTSIA